MCRLSVGKFVNKGRFSGRSGPVNCVPYEGNSVINPPCYLCGEFLESLSPERACGTLRRHRQQGRHSKMEPRVKGSGLVGDSEIVIELIELTLQSGEVARHRRGIANIVVGAKKAIEGGFDERRFCGAWTFGRFLQPRSHGFGEIDSNSGLHGGYS